MWFWSANFEEARVTYDSEDSGDLSLMPQETEKHKQKIFKIKAMLIPDATATREKE